MDNGYPWISTGDLPTELGLWLLGLAVALVPNPPRHPEDNGVVEGAQRTGKRWADPWQCGPVAALQRSIDAMDRHQREAFPDVARSRARLFPGPAHSGRDYSQRREATLWRLDRVRAALAEYVVVRQINARGLVSVYGRNYYVGRRYAGETAYVRLDAASGDWLFELAAGPVLARYAAELTREAILGRRVTLRHHGPAAGRPSGGE